MDNSPVPWTPPFPECAVLATPTEACLRHCVPRSHARLIAGGRPSLCFRCPTAGSPTSPDRRGWVCVPSLSQQVYIQGFDIADTAADAPPAAAQPNSMVGAHGQVCAPNARVHTPAPRTLHPPCTLHPCTPVVCIPQVLCFVRAAGNPTCVPAPSISRLRACLKPGPTHATTLPW